MAPDLPSPDADATLPARITAREFEQLIAENMQTGDRFNFSVMDMSRGSVTIRLRISGIHLRPGNTVAGPVMFMLADTALYAAVLTIAGMQPLAVTTDMTLHFLRRPPAADLIAEARILKAGTKLMVGDVFIRSVECDGPVCHATGTYAVPPRRARREQ